MRMECNKLIFILIYIEMNIIVNPSIPYLYEFAIKNGCKLSNKGALISYSGTYTGRKPDWKRIVLDKKTQNIWWGDVNKPITPETFNKAKETCKNYLLRSEDTNPTFCLHSYLNWSPKFSKKITLFTKNPYHAIFFMNMTIPTKEEFKKKDCNMCIYDAGEKNYIIDDNYEHEGMIGLNFSSKEFVILGTQYAGEIKKGLLTYMMYRMPIDNCLTLHSSANIGNDDDLTLFFGLSGTGKTTLSTESNRKLIGDDEHVWHPDGVFNIEGGCYAKCKDLSEKTEPEIFNAIKFGSVLENVKYNVEHEINFRDTTITQNTRCSYPLSFLQNVQIPAYVDKHPKNIIMLCCDTFGLLPPVVKLSSKQAIYFFINGYTSKIPGTEQGVREPEITFSSCFGEPFLVHHPKKYGDLLKEYIANHECSIWLLNTGWIEGDYKTGRRIPLKYSRKIIDCIHNGSLQKQTFKKYPIFKFYLPQKCSNIPDNILNPLKFYESNEQNEIYLNNLKNLHERFEENYEKLSRSKINISVSEE
jgi:phosphoenolpyruvate carboxykinase (ATP)